MSVTTEMSVKLTPEQISALAFISSAEQRAAYLASIAEDSVAKEAKRVGKKHARQYLQNVGVLPPKDETHDQFLARLGLI